MKYFVKALLLRIGSKLPMLIGAVLIGSEFGFGVGIGVYLLVDPFHEQIIWPDIRKSLSTKSVRRK